MFVKKLCSWYMYLLARSCIPPAHRHWTDCTDYWHIRTGHSFDLLKHLVLICSTIFHMIQHTVLSLRLHRQSKMWAICLSCVWNCLCSLWAEGHSTLNVTAEHIVHLFVILCIIVLDCEMPLCCVLTKSFRWQTNSVHFTSYEILKYWERFLVSFELNV